MSRATVAVAGIAVLAASIAVSVPAAGTSLYPLVATLGTKQEVPQPRHYSVKAGGWFSADYNPKTRKLSWKLTFHNLTTRKAKAAGIYVGRPGEIGPLLIPLCSPCNSGAHGSVKLTKRQTTPKNPWYVNVLTSRNPSGEVRGRVRAPRELPTTGGGAGGGLPPPVILSRCCPPG